MTPSKDIVIIIKSAGEKASAAAHRLYQHGFRKILMTDIPCPLAERREVCFCEALVDGRKVVAGVPSRKASDRVDRIERIWADQEIAVLPDPELRIMGSLRPDCFVDAVMAKKNTGTSIDLAPLVIALGPGFKAGRDAHVVLETSPGSRSLGRLITEGTAHENNGIPTSVSGLTTERIIRASENGILLTLKNIGDLVEKDEIIARAGDSPVRANISGVIWGIVRDGVEVHKGQKIGDIDPRGEKRFCFEIAPQAKTVADGVIEAVLKFLP